MKKLLYLIAFLLPALHSQAQDLYRPGQQRSEYLKLGEQATRSEDYFSAFRYYREAFLFDTTDIDIAYRLAESARLFQAYDYAEKRYTQVVQSDRGNEYPKAMYYLAEMQQFQGKYKDASEHYNLYITEFGSEDDFLTKRASMQREACLWANRRMQNAPDNIMIEHLDETVNTPYSEFGALKHGDKLYFSSMRFPRSNDKNGVDKLRSKILLKGGEETAEEQEDFLVDDIHGAAHTSVTADGQMLYYTLCDYVTDSKLNCKIYSRKKTNDGWGAPQLLPEQINNPGFTATDPAIAFDARMGKYVLYFVSDMPGGQGGKDIWYSVLTSDMEYSMPVNLSGVNTSGDDIAPFLHTGSKMLYFSSNGYRGMGGFDIYKCFVGGKGWGKVEPLPYPVNSSYNDIYYTLSDNRAEAYLASNRIDALHLEEKPKACCYDIYQVTYLPCNIKLLTSILDAESKDSIRGAKLLLVNMDTQDTTLLKDSQLSRYNVPVDCGSHYKLIASKPGYLPAFVDLNTPGSVADTTIFRTLYLQPQRIQVRVTTFNKKTGKPLSGVDVRCSDLNGMKLISSKNTGLDNEVTFTLIPGKVFRINGVKFAYLPDSKELDLLGEVHGPYEIKLYLMPSLGSVLPIALYFDNDRPGRRSWKRTTKETYTETYREYFPKRSEFVEAFSKGGGPEDGARIAAFFDEKVKGGYDQLQLFMEVLLEEMNAGRQYKIEIRGYTSPRASSGYNNNLAARRISSIKNEFKQYKGGVLIPFMKNGKLVIVREKAIGERELPPEILRIRSILENLQDERNSIYSPEASGMRRIDISNVSEK